jgi:hypothetical protein
LLDRSLQRRPLRRPPTAGAHAAVAKDAAGGGWRVDVTAALLLPPGGDAGTLSAELAGPGVTAQRQVSAVGGGRGCGRPEW